MTTDDLLKQGIAALKAGRKVEARRLLTQVVQQDERNEMAWLWLSGAADTDEDRRTCLENVLAINPNNGLAQRGLTTLQKQGSSGSGSIPGVAFPGDQARLRSAGESGTGITFQPAREETATNEILQQAVAAIKSGEKERGRQLLIEALEQDENNEVAWLWMTRCVTDRDVKRECFDRVLVINPDNQHAIEGLKRLEVMSKVERPTKRRIGLMVGLGAVALVIIVTLMGIWWAFNGGLLSLGSAAPTATTQIPFIADATSTPTPTSLVTGLAADYVLSINDLPSSYEFSGGALAQYPGNYLDSYLASFTNRELSPHDPIGVHNLVNVYRTIDEAAGLTSKWASDIAGAVGHSAQEVPVSDFADEVSAFTFVPKGFHIPVVGYSYAFRRANVVTVIMIIGMDSAGSRFSVDDCEFFASQVFLKIERDLRQ